MIFLHVLSLLSQKYQDDPMTLASTISWFLEKEKEILQTADLDQQVEQHYIKLLTRTPETLTYPGSMPKKIIPAFSTFKKQNLSNNDTFSR